MAAAGRSSCRLSLFSTGEDRRLDPEQTHYAPLTASADQSMEKDFVQLPAKQVMLAMLGVMLAMFMAALGQTVVATAMPVIIADLGGFDRYICC